MINDHVYHDDQVLPSLIVMLYCDIHVVGEITLVDFVYIYLRRIFYMYILWFNFCRI